jgi:AAA domain
VGPTHDPSYPVNELRFDDGVLTLRRPPGLPASMVQVWTRTMSPRFLLDRLAQGLRRVGSATALADALVNGSTAGSPTSMATQPGLLPEQLQAFRACLSPGVRLVWDPPGTGKTRVLASAIQELVRRGQRVLLVSTANIAVDNALHEVIPRLAPKPGTAIRIGPAQLRDIADDTVQLERLAAAESASIDRQRDEIALRLSEFEAQDGEVASLRAELRDYRTMHSALPRHESRQSASYTTCGLRSMRRLTLLPSRNTRGRELWSCSTKRRQCRQCSTRFAEQWPTSVRRLMSSPICISARPH